MEASIAGSARLMGDLLVERNIITSEQLEQALRLQKETGNRIGEIVVSEFGVSRVEIAGVLSEQWADLEQAERAKNAEESARAKLKAAPDPVKPLTPAEVKLRRPLGQILVERGFITKEQLDAALAAQPTSGSTRIGEILIEQGALTRLDLASALGEQWSTPPTSGLSSTASDRETPRDGLRVATAPAQGWSAADRDVIADLEERLRGIESAAGELPSQEDLSRVALDLRATIGDVEKRLEATEAGAATIELSGALEAVGARIEKLESASIATELEAVRQELEELKTRPVTVAGLDEIRATIASLESRPDGADEISQLAKEVSALATRLDQLVDAGELKERLETIAGQTDAAQAGFAGLERRIDELAGLESRLDAVAERVPDASLIDELVAAG